MPLVFTQINLLSFAVKNDHLAILSLGLLKNHRIQAFAAWYLLQ